MAFTFCDALNIAIKAYYNVKDKGGEDYIKHPLRLWYRLREKGHSNAVQMIAILHDVVEDSDITIDELKRMGCPEEVTDALVLLTHDKAVPYMDYVSKIKYNPYARGVKLEDLLDNSDIRRIPPDQAAAESQKVIDRYVKYSRALEVLR